MYHSFQQWFRPSEFKTILISEVFNPVLVGEVNKARNRDWFGIKQSKGLDEIC